MVAETPRRKPDSARRANRIIQQRTFLLLMVFGVGAFVLLFTQLYKWQIVRHEELQNLAVRQQTLRTTVEANRGTIFDRNGEILAISSTAENVCISPLDIEKNGHDKELIATNLAQILQIDVDHVRNQLQKTAYQYIVLKEKAEKDTADAVRAFITEHKLRGIFLEPTAKRYYPKSTLAAHAIGFVNKNGGAYGLEAVYDETLTGESGMVVTARDGNGGALLYQYEQYFDARNGDSLVTTLDTTIQYYLEKGLEELESRYGTGVGATGIVMDVNTSAILAMASLPTYDLNAPGTIYNREMIAKGMDDEQISANLGTLQLQQWRNKSINDTFQPGSTFKILTLSMALEEGAVSTKDTFYCPGYIVVEGTRINCSKREPGHQHQTLTEATGNSCNPAFINIGMRLGNTVFYDYMKAFGLTSKSGIDTTGEATGFVNSEIEYSTLALACYAFGQNFNVTPISLINAQAACINGGYLREPYIVAEVRDKDGNIKMQQDTTPIRQIISEETSETVRGVLEYVVSEGTGKNGRVAGYRIGGKTGTADKVNGEVIVSFVCFAPADDPQVIMLITLDEPSDYTGTYVSGGQMVAPVASSVMSEILPYLGYEPHYSAEELVGADKSVPNVVGMSVEAAKAALAKEGFACTVIGEADAVTDQTPLGGAIVPNNANILLYCGSEKSEEMCTVPNVVGDSPAAANQKITDAGLIMSVSGATTTGSSTVRAINQSVAPESQVKAGTVVRVQFSDHSVTD
ncbi:MAG: PASTA domain-containing protein [Oscillospiraceae bacterium]|nr:PASTA domain-containing protein [Oscillospiraceae bacterium]